jgi:hypothetical protein
MRPAASRLTLGIVLGLLISAAVPVSAAASFGFQPGEAGFRVRAIADGGATATQAGLHPYQLDLGFGFNQAPAVPPAGPTPEGDPRELTLSLPPGMLLNPSPFNVCQSSEFTTPRSSPFETSSSGESCPAISQLGTAEVSAARDGGAPLRFGLFNLKPPRGVAASIGFSPYGKPIVFDLTIPEEGERTSTLVLHARALPRSLDITGLRLSFWGASWMPSHDGERGNCLNEAEPTFPWAKCSVPRAQSLREVAFVSLPARCSPDLGLSATATSWQGAGPTSVEAFNRSPGGPPLPLTGCENLRPETDPIGLLNDIKASSPSGYHLALKSNTATVTNLGELLTPSIRRMQVVLPDGVTINPSVGAGLQGCSQAQFAAETVSSAQGDGCPNGSKIGDFSARSALFDPSEIFAGSIYLATPRENQFDNLIAFYLVAKLPQRGIQVKVAGRIDPDPATGDLVATVDNLPQIPYTDLELDFNAGQRAFLITPPACGQARTTITLTSWVEGIAPIERSNISEIETGIDGGPCPSGTPPFNPGAVAGAYNSNVGSYTPYFVHLTRRDTEQEITSYSLVLPKGITAKLAGVPFCPEADIAAARSRTGTAEEEHPSCPAASQVGRTVSGYGVGKALTYANGRVYLAGPYHGAPLSLVTVNSATIGPFDLGTIVIRSAFQVDPLTAQLRIDSSASDPIPHIIDGVPLHLREVRIYVDRPEFTHNPSSCEASKLESTLTGSGATFSNPADDSSASAQSYFQLLNCLTLGFRPQLGIRLRGGSKRGDYPSMRATFGARGPQDSNLKRIEVTMPHSEFLAQNHIRAICTRPQFQAEKCPKGSAYGEAVLYTPLFDQPLRGEVFLRSSENAVPDLVANLRSGAIRIELKGKISSAHGGIRVFFDEVPDAPINRFVMTLYGGKRGLLVNSSNICAQPPLATVRALGQNNSGASFSSRLRGQCNGKGKKHKGGDKKGAKS